MLVFGEGELLPNIIAQSHLLFSAFPVYGSDE